MSKQDLRKIAQVERASKDVGLAIQALVEQQGEEVMHLLRAYCRKNDIGWVMGMGTYFFTAAGQSLSPLGGGPSIGDLDWVKRFTKRGPLPQTEFTGRELAYLLNEGLDSPWSDRGWSGDVKIPVEEILGEDEWREWEVTVNPGAVGVAIVNLLRSTHMNGPGGASLIHPQLAWWTQDIPVGRRGTYVYSRKDD